MTSPIHLKTVFDAKQPDRFGIHEPLLRLHVASWHRNVRKSTGLTVTLIGDPSPGLAEFLKDLGAEWDQIGDWHPLHHRSPIYNKHLAKPPGTMTDRIYLTDNDTVYLADIDSLLAVPSGTVGVSLPDNRRVEPVLWEEMRADIGLEVLEFDWIPNKEKATAFVEGRPAVREKYGYFNGGAILFPGGPDFWDLWERNTYRLSSYFERRGLHDRKDAGSDQLSLTTAVAIYGNWSFLPTSYNVRPFQFWLEGGGDDPVEQIHMVNSGRAARHLGSPEACRLPKLLETYWDLFYRENIHPIAAEKAEAVLRACLSIVAEYDL